MRHTSPDRAGLFTLVLALVAMVSAGCAHEPPQPEQRTFKTPGEATDALVGALRAWSPDQFHQILGPVGGDVLDSGDAVADHNAADRFLREYDEKHELVTGGDGQVILVVGRGDWPMPIPLVREKDGWRFDSEAGKDEIINRRVGRNELDTIEVCRAIADAQREYALFNPNGDDVHEYARKFLSDPGKRDGLYWPTAEGEAPSPLGPLVAAAVEQGYSASANPSGQARPYHGYCFRMLTAQGESAKGGVQDYVVKGRMIGGFAAVAYPADYGNSGVMTFMVNHEGVVYQKDLGDDTENLARAMKAFDPGPGWQAVPETMSGEKTAAAAAGRGGSVRGLRGARKETVGSRRSSVEIQRRGSGCAGGEGLSPPEGREA
jgi:hypothetical protein